MARQAHAEGRYSDAIDAFRAAYELQANPRYLYNIGRCYERLRDDVRAADYLSSFLEHTTDPADRADAEAVLAVIRVRLERAEEGADPRPAPTDCVPRG